MKREYFTVIFLVVSVLLILVFDHFFGSEVVADKIYKFIVIWLIIAYSLGQYSTKFPKAF